MKRTWVLNVIGAIIGAGAGWLYWNYVGCASGTCAITFSPVNSTLYGAVMGVLLVGALRPGPSKATSGK